MGRLGTVRRCKETGPKSGAVRKLGLKLALKARAWTMAHASGSDVGEESGLRPPTGLAELGVRPARAPPQPNLSSTNHDVPQSSSLKIPLPLPRFRAAPAPDSGSATRDPVIDLRANAPSSPLTVGPSGPLFEAETSRRSPICGHFARAPSVQMYRTSRISANRGKQ